jgi:hypothetical protein
MPKLDSRIAPRVSDTVTEAIASFAAEQDLNTSQFVRLLLEKCVKNFGSSQELLNALDNTEPSELELMLPRLAIALERCECNQASLVFETTPVADEIADPFNPDNWLGAA